MWDLRVTQFPVKQQVEIGAVAVTRPFNRTALPVTTQPKGTDSRSLQQPRVAQTEGVRQVGSAGHTGACEATEIRQWR